jgi:hypothetical protein
LTESRAAARISPAKEIPMTNREREYAALGFEYAEGIELADRVNVPSTGREVRKTAKGTWEAQPWNDNYWKEFDDLLEALKFATRPTSSGG